MIVLFDRVSDALERGRRMIELARDLDLQFGMSRDGVIVNRDSTIGGNEFAGSRQNKRINFERPRFHAVRGGEQFANRFGQLWRLIF